MDLFRIIQLSLYPHSDIVHNKVKACPTYPDINLKLCIGGAACLQVHLDQESDSCLDPVSAQMSRDAGDKPLARHARLPLYLLGVVSNTEVTGRVGCRESRANLPVGICAI